MRISPLFFSLLLCLGGIARLPAQNPGAQQDAEEARQKLLRAADQIDNLQANAEATKAAVDAMKADLDRLETELAALNADNATLHQQVSDLHTALDASEAARVKERKALLDSVAEMIAAGNKGSAKPTKKKPAPDDTPPPAPTSDTPTGSTLAPPPDTATTPDPATKSQKGYYHIVASGETLTLICNAYKQNGVNVTVSAIEKANGLTDKSVLKIGQKLFIPKPGT